MNPAGLHLNSWHTFVVEGLVCAKPALIVTTSLISSLEDGLWTRKHFLSIDMGGTGDCLTFLGLYDYSDGHSSQNFHCVQCCRGVNFLGELVRFRHVFGEFRQGTKYIFRSCRHGSCATQCGIILMEIFLDRLAARVVDIMIALQLLGDCIF